MSKLYDRYSVLKEVGAGGFSRVYQAVPKSVVQKKAEEKGNDNYTVEELTAIKVVRSRDYDHELKDVAENEVAILIELEKIKEHRKSILQFIEVFREPRRIAIVTEYLEGGELFERIIERKYYSEKNAMKTMHSLIAALNAVHDIGIVHRDLKPENLVYKYRSLHEECLKRPDANIDDSEDCLKLMDFGLSKFINGKEPHAGALYVGTPGYIAPEVVDGKPSSPKSDIFSVGVILYIILSGRMPFAGETSSAINTRIKNGKFAFRNEIWKTVSKEAHDLISSMLEVEPSRRISGPEALAHPWFKQMNEIENKSSNEMERIIKGIADTYKSAKTINELNETLMNYSTELSQKIRSSIKEEYPTGLPASKVIDVTRKIFSKEFAEKDDKDLKLPASNTMSKRAITRGEFRRIVQALELEDLPIDKIFSAVLQAKEETMSVETISHNSPAPNESGFSGKKSNNTNGTGGEVKGETVRLRGVKAGPIRKAKNVVKNGAKKINERFSGKFKRRRENSVTLIPGTYSHKIVRKPSPNKTSGHRFRDIDMDEVEVIELIIALTSVTDVNSTDELLELVDAIFGETAGDDEVCTNIAKVFASYKNDQESSTAAFNFQVQGAQAVARTLTLIKQQHGSLSKAARAGAGPFNQVFQGFFQWKVKRKAPEPENVTEQPRLQPFRSFFEFFGIQV